MKRNYKESIITLIGGVGALPILMSIFMGVLEFGYAIIIAFVFFLVAGTLNGLLIETPSEPGPLLLQESQKQAILSLVGGIGVIVLLFGLFTQFLSFEYSIVISYGFFLITGVLGQIIEVESSGRGKEEDYSYKTKGFENGKQEKIITKTPGKCSSCGRSIEKNDIFCSSCGAEQTNF